MNNMLADFWRKQEVAIGRIIPVSEVARETGLSWDTVKALKEGKISRVDFKTISKICRFFEIPEGVPVPFLIVDYGE